MGLLRWQLLPILLIGLANIPLWYGFAYWGQNPWLSVVGLLVLALVAGWFATRMVWGVVLAMLPPIMFVGGEHHGYPWQWLIVGVRYPPLLIYFLMNMTPIISGYVVLISLGRYARFKLLPGDSRDH